MNPHEIHDSGRYVIQRHVRGGDVHWDLMLESGDVLQTWRLDLPPEQCAHAAAQAKRIADHPLRFLTYEGPVNRGSGMATIADCGTYAVLARSADRMEMRLHGRILDGVFRMDDSGDGDCRITPADGAP